jgi:ribosome maturation factor RimP
VEVLTIDGEIKKGKLEDVSQGGFVVSEEKMVKPEGRKKKELQIFTHQLRFDAVKRVKEILTL